MKTSKKLFFYKTYFKDFFDEQNQKVKDKIIWTLNVVETLDTVPEIYFKHLTGTRGLYEIRVQSSSNIFRVFCFFDDKNIIVIGHGFQKKTDKTPKQELEKAEKIKQQYYEEKKFN